MKRALLLLVAALAAAVFFVLGARAPSTEPTAADEPSRTVAVEVAVPAMDSLVSFRRYPGTLEAERAYTVAPRVAGRIVRVHVDIGDTVVRGDRLVTLDDAEFRQELAAARADLAVANAEREQAASALALAERRLDRIRRLERDGIAAASELEDAEAERAAQHAALAVAEARIARARSARETASLRLADTRIVADWNEAEDGSRVVGERMVDAGDTVAANAPLLSVLDTESLRAIIRVPQTVYGQLAVGQIAELSASALPEPRFTAEVARVAPAFDVESRQARVELRVDNPDGWLAPGMYVQVALQTERIDEQPVVPVTALVERSGRQGIFGLDADGSRARFMPVQVLLRSDARAALALEGDMPDEVVVLGQDRLRDGMRVTRAGEAPS